MVGSAEDGEEVMQTRNWRVSLLLWVAVVVGLTAAYWTTAASMVGVWWSSATFNHGFLIPAIFGWLVWERRDYLAQVTPSPSSYGLVGLLGAAVLWMLGWLADVQMVQQFAYIFTIQASVVAVLGLAVTRVILFPLCYLVFCVPFGEELIAPMQDFTATFVVAALEIIGIPVFSDGIFISIPRGNFEVAEACSGVRFMIATLALGTLFANLSFKSWSRRAALMALVIVIPIIANGIRALGIVMIAHWSNMKYAVGADHIIYGWVFLAIVTILILAIGMTFADRKASDPIVDLESTAPAKGWAPSTVSFSIAALAAITVGISGPAYARVIDGRDVRSAIEAIADPDLGPDWQIIEPRGLRWEPVYRNNDAELRRSFRHKSGRRVDLYVAYYDRQRPGTELIQFGNTIAAPDYWGLAGTQTKQINVRGDDLATVRSRLVAGTRARAVWQWYWIDNQLTTNPYAAKILAARAKLFHGREAAATLVIATEMSQLATGGDRILQGFLESLGRPDAYLEKVGARAEARRGAASGPDGNPD